MGWSIASRLSGCWAVWGVKRAPGSIVILPEGGWEEKSAWRLTHLINNRDRQQAHLDLYCPSLMLSKYSIYLHAQHLFRHTYTHTHQFNVSKSEKLACLNMITLPSTMLTQQLKGLVNVCPCDRLGLVSRRGLSSMMTDWQVTGEEPITRPDCSLTVANSQ